MTNAIATLQDAQGSTLKQQLTARREFFQRMLPQHISIDRFESTVLTAVQQNPELANADKQSFWLACQRAASDGLLPDGRQGAIVTFRTKRKYTDDKGVQREEYFNKAQWMPMVWGIIQKVRNSGELSTITARIVSEGDRFRFWIDDRGDHIEFEPCDEPGKPIRAFAIAKMTRGEIYVEVMTVAEIEKVREVSRAKNDGPWTKWWEEMAKKTVIRRLAKRLPVSSDLDTFLRGDDEEEAAPAPAPLLPPRMAQQIDAKPEPRHEPDLPTGPTLPGPGKPERREPTSDELLAAAVAQFEENTLTAQSMSDLQDCFEPLKGVDLPRELAERTETAYFAAEKRINAAAAEESFNRDFGPPNDDPPKHRRDVAASVAAEAAKSGHIDPAHPAYARGWRDAKAGVTRLESPGIRSDPVARAHWQAGQDAAKEAP